MVTGLVVFLESKLNKWSKLLEAHKEDLQDAKDNEKEEREEKEKMALANKLEVGYSKDEENDTSKQLSYDREI